MGDITLEARKNLVECKKLIKEYIESTWHRRDTEGIFIGLDEIKKHVMTIMDNNGVRDIEVVCNDNSREIKFNFKKVGQVMNNRGRVVVDNFEVDMSSMEAAEELVNKLHEKYPDSAQAQVLIKVQIQVFDGIVEPEQVREFVNFCY